MLAQSSFDAFRPIRTGIQFRFKSLEDGPVSVTIKINHLCGYTQRIFEVLIANGHGECLLLAVPDHDARAVGFVLEEGSTHRAGKAWIVQFD